MSQSALSALHELEQSYAQAAVPRPAPDPHVMLWVGTHLGVAGVPLLVGAGELDEIIETPEVTPIPGTLPWVMGLGTHKGGLLPIISGDALFRGVAYAGRVREYCMVIRRPGFHFGITLSAVHRDLKFPIEERDMTHPVDPDFAEFSLGGFYYDDQFLAVLDIDKLVAEGVKTSAAATDGEKHEDLSA